MIAPIHIGERVVEVAPGAALIDICDREDLPLYFSCRGGACGTCLVHVLEGAENVSPPSDSEEVLLPELTTDPRARLACQLRIHGPVRLQAAG